MEFLLPLTDSIPLSKKCQHCGGTFRRHMRWAIGAWMRAKFCTERCMQAARIPPPQTCPTCGMQFIPKQGKSRPQRYCGLSCANRGRGVNPITTRYRSLKVNGKRVLEHRSVMEEELGRKLRQGEIVHHKDGNKLNNHPDNLDVTTLEAHGLMHHAPKNPVTSKCAICAKEFRPHKTKRGRKRTCSPKCKAKLLATEWRKNHGHQNGLR